MGDNICEMLTRDTWSTSHHKNEQKDTAALPLECLE